MGCYRIQGNNANVVCPCGNDRSLRLDELSLQGNTVAIPVCPNCGDEYFLIVNSFSAEQFDAMPEVQKKRNAINHTLYRRLYNMGKRRPVRSGQSADMDNINEFTRFNVDDEVVEASLNSRIAMAKEAKEKGLQRPDKKNR